MRLLLDTHFLIWLANDPGELSVQEREATEQADELFVSVVSLWEVRTKWYSVDRTGRRKGVIDPEAALVFAQRSRMLLAAVEPADALIALNPRPSHRDPFDEMLLVHAQRLGARLLTRDGKLVGHPLAYAP